MAYWNSCHFSCMNKSRLGEFLKFGIIQSRLASTVD